MEEWLASYTTPRGMVLDAGSHNPSIYYKAAYHVGKSGSLQGIPYRNDRLQGSNLVNYLSSTVV